MAAPSKAEPPPSPHDLLLPYQRDWVRDQSRFKIWLKSRQVGGSLGAAFEIVDDALHTQADWIVLSAGERQALEFMQKVHQAARIFCQAISAARGQEEAAETKASQIKLPNGARILALPANPSTARGYSANLVLDEFAFHERPEEIWRAVYPIITNPLRGQLKLRIISTPAGMNNKFYDLWSNAPDFSRHKTSIYDAVDQGLNLNIAELKSNLADPDGWAQEFECQFMEHSSQVFPMDLIRSVEDSRCSTSWDGPTILPTYVGIDLGRRHDLTVCWTLERSQGLLYTREILVLDNVPFPEQEELIASRVATARYIAIDSTGIGGPISEHLAKRLVDYKLDPVNFTQNTKRELFSRAKKAFQSGEVRIPSDPRLRDDFASVQRIVTPQGAIKYTAARTRDGHADRATALALALHAASKFPEAHAPSQPASPPIPNKRHHKPRRTRFRPAWENRS